MANKVGSVFILCTVLFASLHHAQGLPRGADACERACYERCEKESAWFVPCDAKCYLSACVGDSEVIGILKKKITSNFLAPSALPDKDLEMLQILAPYNGRLQR
ncbi:hypothetical protein ACHQM5_006087 [Ranunculus cassubicifolius]